MNRASSFFTASIPKRGKKSKPESFEIQLRSTKRPQRRPRLATDPLVRFERLYARNRKGCWLWTGALTDKGYALFWSGTKTVLAHKWRYEFQNGLVPKGLQLDHTCRRRHCVNPGHLEPVTGSVNVRRGIRGQMERSKKRCPKGHAYSPENTLIVSTTGERRCRACRRNSVNNARRK